MTDRGSRLTKRRSDAASRSQRRSKLLSGAFSLLELLAVLAILGILTACIVPLTNSVIEGAQLSQGGQMIVDQLAYARQRALSRNQSVEVRFYKFRAPGDPVAAASGYYRALQLFEAQESGAVLPLDKMRRLPGSLILDSNDALSSIFSDSQKKQWSHTDPQISLPELATSYECTSFLFLPDGTASLKALTTPAFLTLHHVRFGHDLTEPPTNFFCIQLNPYNGTTRTFRP